MTSRQRSPKSPETFLKSRLAATDFDKTVALTTEPSPAGVGVIEAYDIAVDAVFDPDQFAAYQNNNGLRNRAPFEVVSELMPGAYVSEIKDKEHELNKAKLDVLLGQIGTRFADGQLWPRPVPGYLEFCERMHETRDAGIRVEDAIISSGHEAFIRKTYDVWAIRYPDHLITVETLERFGMGSETKPSPRLMDIARGFWRAGYGLPFWEDATDEELALIAYAGDDPVKDGGLATNSRVPFVLIPDAPESREGWQRMATQCRLLEAATRGMFLHD